MPKAPTPRHTIADAMVSLRRSIHADPELGLHLPRTQERVLSALEPLGLETTTGSRLSSVVSVIRGGRRSHAKRRPVVLLRADMDAVPVTEEVNLPYRSQTAGIMHACGHDLHTAMLVGAAHHLTAARDDLAGDVVLMFQPGEEGYDGAAHMIAEGVLDASGERVDAAYAIHVQSTRVRGEVATRPGPVLSGHARLRVTVHGVGGHGAMPHRAVDPVPPLAEMITAVNAIAARKFDAFDPVIIGVGRVEAGSHGAAIPSSGFFEATVRTYSETNRIAVRERLSTLVHAIAAAHGTTADIDYAAELPVTVTDAAETGFAVDVVKRSFGPHRFAPMTHPHVASEDFSRVLAKVPGAFLFLGARPDHVSSELAQENHSPNAVFDDSVLDDGARLFADLAATRLDQGHQGSNRR